MKTLFVGAHPDDIEINAGGTIARMVAGGHEVHVAVISHHRDSDRGVEGVAALLELGVHFDGIRFLGLSEPDFSVQAAHQALEAVVRRIQPDVVFTHHYADTHQDHRTTYEATMVAARFVKSVYLYIPTYPSGRTSEPAHPNVVSLFEEVHLNAKLAALTRHASQCKKYGQDLWLKSIEAICRGDAWRHAGTHGCAELFQLSRMQF